MPSPRVSSKSVFFIGNGIMRVPCQIISSTANKNQTVGPSWLDYMDSLWHLVHASHGSGSSQGKLLDRGDFARLSAPRQAEWFDRSYDTVGSRIRPVDLPALRLHELGKTLHSSSGLLTNPLIQTIAHLVLQSSGSIDGRHSVVDVVTTNLDCSIEQNVAAAVDALPSPQAAEIEVIVDFRRSILWSSAGDRPDDSVLRIRLWKLHGCLRDLSARIDDSSRNRILTQVEVSRGAGFCGALPKDQLLPEGNRKWHAIDANSEAKVNRGVFSQSEYFRNIRTLVELQQEAQSSDPSEDPVPAELFRALVSLLRDRELLFIGYSLSDEDVDILYLLQTYPPRDSGRPQRWKLAPSSSYSVWEEERLNQMGIAWWPFQVSALGHCPEPNRLRAAAALEWRSAESQHSSAANMVGWRESLQRVISLAWLVPQLAALRALLTPISGQGNGYTPAMGSVPADLPVGPRMVVAGLASIWHAFALHEARDFPLPRRVSAQLSSIDEQVPGGSGLVPVMIGAVAAGPQCAGSVAFLSNVPAEWNSWKEIEEFCLSAGIDIRPLWSPETGPGTQQEARTARTSHVLFYDERSEDRAYQPPWSAKQRFIMDVHSFAREPIHSRDSKVPGVPPARVPEGFNHEEPGDFLFADKEVDWQVIRNWHGPTVLETGSSGIELLPSNRRGKGMPSVWTSGIGSFVRTVVESQRIQSAGSDPADTPEQVVERLREFPALRALLKGCDERHSDYVGRLVSRDKPAWRHGGRDGFSNSDETEFGRYLQAQWFGVTAILRKSLTDLLRPPHPVMGRGVVTTCHEAGLMAAWQFACGRTEDTVVKIQSTQSPDGTLHYALVCEVRRNPGAETARENAAIWIDPKNRLHFRLADAKGSREVDLGLSTPYRRNTLAAGDTVRGALCYGLWAITYGVPTGAARPSSIPRVLMASAVLATLKCYAGSFVDFLKLIERIRGGEEWNYLWEGSL
jgi:hypothetical protein